MKRTIVGRVKSNKAVDDVGRVKSNKAVDDTKIKNEGVGDNRTEKVVREKSYFLKVLSENGDSITMRGSDPFDVVVSQDIRIELQAQKQKQLDA